MTARQWKNKLFRELETTYKRYEDTKFEGIKYKVYKDIPEVLRVTQDDIEKRVWLADEPKTKTVRIKKFNGDSIDITYAGEKKYRSVFLEEAVIHPDSISEERLEEHGYEIKDGRKNA